MDRRTTILNIDPDKKFSFSKLTLFQLCPNAFKHQYIDQHIGESNVFADYGQLMHSILERYAKGELELWDLSNVFEWEFDTLINNEFPYDSNGKIRNTYKEQGIQFLNNFPGYDDIKILGVEQEILLPKNDWYLHGFIDLLYETSDGELIIRDYKSKTSFKNKKEQKEYARQLYLYSNWVYNEHGRYPNTLEFLLFRNNALVKIPFDINDYNETFAWAEETIDQIKQSFDYPPKYSSYYCNNICDYKSICEFIDDY